ncbi:MAG: type II toxin-antitoxin system PemK/MazF family toxin [Prolixibacteraceae bacterium]|nr:type II toxin-antitoxin system PemK/MazF family toxin [Prolixibacteraceae bacterium]
MKQKEIWLVNLNPVKGSEQKGLRPAVIISGNVLNNLF